MANPKRGEVEVLLGRDPESGELVRRTLRMGFNAFASLERLTGKSVQELAAPGRMGLGDVRDILWAGLLHEEPRLQPETVGAWMDHTPEELATWMVACAKAITLGLGVRKEDVDGDKKDGKRPLAASAPATASTTTS